MSKLPGRAELRRKLARNKANSVDETQDVPGPSANPATNLLFADIVMRMGSYALRKGVERAFLSGRYGKGTAKNIVANRSLGRTLTSVAIAKFGTKSLPGAALVSTGLIGKILYDRSRSRHEAEIEGDAELIEQAETPSGRPDS